MSDLALTAESPSLSPLSDEVARRRTFAIISHPDAGKTTLTEKLLLFGGAIQMAGSVKSRKAARHAGGIAEQRDPQDRGADRANPGPHRVGGSHRQRLQRQAQHPDAGGHAEQGQDGGNEAAKTLGIFQPDGPADFEQTGNQQQ